MQPKSRPFSYSSDSFYSVSTLFLFTTFGDFRAHLTLLTSSAATFLIAKYIKGPSMPWIGALFLMAHLSYNQITRQLSGRTASSGSWVVDVSTPQTVLVVKLTAYCWNVHDGRQNENKLSASQKDRAIRELPSLPDFAGYVLFFPTLLTGPGFDYTEYRRWIDMTMFDVPLSAATSEFPSRTLTISSSLFAATSKASQAFLWLIVSIKLSALTPISTLLSSSFLSQPILSRLLHLHIFSLITRTRCYAIWTLTEGSLTATGITYSGTEPVTNEPTWTRMRNVNPFAIETALNPHAVIANWNINTARWLKNYVYLRVVPRGEKGAFMASLATFVWSAVWHGFYPGYYVFFIFVGVLEGVAKGMSILGLELLTTAEL